MIRACTLYIRLFAWFSVRHLIRNRGRAAAVCLGVALGAAVFTSVRLSVHASVSAFSRSMHRITGAADYIISRPGGRIPESLVAGVLRQPSVRAASPVLSAYVQPQSTDAEPFLLIGFDPILDVPLRQWRTRHPETTRSDMWLTLMQRPFSFMAGRALAAGRKWSAGDEIVLFHADRVGRFRLTDLLAAEDLGLAENGQVAITDIATFQEFTGHIGWVDRIDIAVRPGTTREQMARIRATLPAGVLLQPAAGLRTRGEEMIRAYQLNLSILSFASLFVGMFLVYSLVALNAATRRREVAILRASGASPGMVLMLFLGEGILLGAVGWAIAVPLSGVGVRYLITGVSRTISTLFVPVHGAVLSLSFWELGLGFALTVLISAAAALQPAMEAMGVSPRDVLATAWFPFNGKDASRRLGLLGFGAVALVIPLSALPGPPGIPVPGYAAIILLFAGFSLLAPFGLRRTGRIIAPALRRCRYAGITAYLAGRYVGDSGTRTAVSVGALITAVALYVALVIMIFSFRETVKLWVDQTVSGDLFVAARMADVNQFRDPLPPRTIAALANLKTPVERVPSRRWFLRYGGHAYQLEAMETRTFLKHGDFVWLKGDPAAARSRLTAGRGVLISEVFANRTGMDIGDLFAAEVPAARVRLPVVGIIRDYRTRGGVVFCDFSCLERQISDPGWTGVRFYLSESVGDRRAGLGRLKREIIDACGDTVEMIDGESLRGSVLRIFDQTFAVTTVLLLIALAVAALGIATTLAVLVLERSRQLHTLLAVGAAMTQIRSMILWETAIMVAAGQLAGLLCGFMLSHLLVYVINRHSFGWTFLYSVDWGTLAWSLPLVAATAVAAALPALRSVFREPPAALLRER